MDKNEVISDRVLKRNQIEILSLAEGFFQSSVLFALLKLRIFERISNNSKSLPELASDLNVRQDTFGRLLNAGVVLDLLESEDGFAYRVSSVCRTVLAPSAGEHYLGNWILNLDYFRVALSKLDEAVKNPNP
jgi:hypothetical protein